MELKRRRKEEEKTSTENKIEEVKVRDLKAFVLITFLSTFLSQKSIQNAERSKARKEYLQETVLPFCIGLMMFVAGGYFYFRHVRL